jgi:hypothetical protein
LLGTPIRTISSHNREEIIMNKKVAVLILLGLLAGRATADEVIVETTEEPVVIEE